MSVSKKKQSSSASHHDNPPVILEQPSGLWEPPEDPASETPAVSGNGGCCQGCHCDRKELEKWNDRAGRARTVIAVIQCLRCSSL